MWVGGQYDPHEQEYIPNPGSAQLLETVDEVYYISWEPGALDRIAQQYGYVKSIEALVPPGGSRMLTEPWTVFTMPICLGCHKDMPDDVVYEFVKTMGENVLRLKDFHIGAKATDLDYMCRLNVPEKFVHLGALKYYEEIGRDQYVTLNWFESAPK